jgi:hypothetical protein
MEEEPNKKKREREVTKPEDFFSKKLHSVKGEAEPVVIPSKATEEQRKQLEAWLPNRRRINASKEEK